MAQDPESAPEAPELRVHSDPTPPRPAASEAERPVDAANPAAVADPAGGLPPDGEPADSVIIASVLRGDPARFEILIRRHSPRVFATARRYARRENEVEDIAQEVWTKAYQKLAGFRGDAPFEHWLMRLAVRTCYDFLRRHQRNREDTFTDLTEPEQVWLDQFVTAPEQASDESLAARQLVERVLAMLSPPARLVITLLELEDRSVKEIAALTGWSVPLVKVRAFRARAEMKRCLQQIARDKYL